MTPKEVYIVVPTCRPRFVQNVLDNFNRQRFSERKLVVVENGPAVGAYARFADVIISCAQNVGVAREMGVAAVRERGGYVVFMDDDDYYGPDYITEVVEYARRGQVTAKANYFVNDTVSGQLRLFKWAEEDSWVELVHGATLSFWADEAAEFLPVRRWGEDLDWLSRMKKAGKSVYSTSRYNYMCVRYSAGHRHSWPCNSRTMVNSCKGPVYNLGEVDPYVIDGRKPCPDGVLLNEGRVGPQMPGVQP